MRTNPSWSKRLHYHLVRWDASRHSIEFHNTRSPFIIFISNPRSSPPSAPPRRFRPPWRAASPPKPRRKPRLSLSKSTKRASSRAFWAYESWKPWNAGGRRPSARDGEGENRGYSSNFEQIFCRGNFGVAAKRRIRETGHLVRPNEKWNVPHRRSGILFHRR